MVNIVKDFRGRKIYVYDDKEQLVKSYDIKKKLGEGSFGKVYEAVTSDGQRIALKTTKPIDPNNTRLIQQTIHELDFLKRLATPNCNPNVICYYDSYYDERKGEFLIEMELVEGPNLHEFVKTLQRTQPKEVGYYYLLLIAKGIAKGLQYSHRKGIIHNDIKADNIVIDQNNVPRIIDYGLSCNMNRSGMCVSASGTPHFVPPEYTNRYPASDMWALGVTLFVLIAGKYPFNFKAAKTYDDIINIIKTTQSTKLNSSNTQLNKIVNRMLVRDPRFRMTSMEVANMPVSEPTIFHQENIETYDDDEYLGVQAMDISKVSNEEKQLILGLLM